MKHKPTGWNWGGEPITHYVEIETVTAVFNSRSEIVGYQPYTMRLPFTEAQWERYQQLMFERDAMVQRLAGEGIQ